MVDYVKYGRSHYERNKPTYLARAAARKAKNKSEFKTYIQNHLLKNPCIDCGEDDPLVLEFDHRERSLKKFNIGDCLKRGFRLETLIEEIAKCDVRCANCHRRKTTLEIRGRK